MKKLVLITIAFMLVAAVYASTPIQVKKPDTDHIVYHGNVTGYMIKWIVTGQVHEFVKIRLFDKTGNTKIYGITEKTPTSDGQYLWPANMINSTNYGDYVIRVKTLDNNDHDDSGIFHIKKKLIDPENTKELLEKVQDKPKFPISKEFMHLKPDLKIAVGPNPNPPFQNSYFNIIVSNIGKIQTPKPTHDKIIFYYWGKFGNSPPEHLMDMVVTEIPVIGAKSNHVHIITYKFEKPGKYTFSAFVNTQEMKKFEESDPKNNWILPAKEFWVKY